MAKTRPTSAAKPLSPTSSSLICQICQLPTSAGVFCRVQLEKQHEQKVRQALETARCEWEKQQRQESTKEGEEVKRQQELWAKERQESQSALEKLKRELATAKKEYSIATDKLKRELFEERKKTQYISKRRDSRNDSSQVIWVH